MTTRFPFRVYLVVPAARLPALNEWIAEEIDPTGESWLAPTLSPTGDEPATHGWASFAATDEQADRWVVRLAETVGAEPPEGFEGYTRAQKVAYLQAAAPVLLLAAGVRVWLVDNAGTWPDPAALLAEAGLKAVTPGPA